MKIKGETWFIIILALVLMAGVAMAAITSGNDGVIVGACCGGMGVVIGQMISLDRKNRRGGK